MAIHDRLGALVLQGADAGAITVALAELVDRPVLLLDALLRPLTIELRWPVDKEMDVEAGLLWDPNEAYVGRVIQTMAGERRSMRLPPLPAWGVGHGCVLAPVAVGDATLGYLAILEPETGEDEAAPAEAELLAAQHAASVYALALMRERLAAEVTTELRDQLLEGLLVGQVTDEQATRERARRLGYDEALSYQALVLVPDEGGARSQSLLAREGWAAGWRRRLLDSVAQLVRDRAPQAIVTRRRDELVALVPQGIHPGPSDLARTVTLYVASLYPEWPLTIGLGGVCRAPREIAAPARRSGAPPRWPCASAAGARSSTSMTWGSTASCSRSATAPSCEPSSSRSSARFWSTTASTGPTSSARSAPT